MNIKLNLPAEPFSGQIVTFIAPCDCAAVTDGLCINDETYTVCNSLGKCVTGVGGAWIKNAQVSVSLDCTLKKAYVLNAGSNQCIESEEHPGCYYRIVDGEVEWLNPPYEFNTEYRTSERFNGKIVYTKLVNCGNPVPPTDSLTGVDLGGFDVERIIRHCGTYRYHPLDYYGDLKISYIMESTVRVTTTGSYNMHDAYVQVWYTKR